MRINFEIEHNFENPLKSIPSVVCKFRGHDWRRYKEDPNANISILDVYFKYMNGESLKKYKQCKRCQEFKYRTIKHKSKTVTFSRYSPLGKVPKTATEVTH